MALTWAGVLVMVAVMVWSLRRQRRCLATELVGEVRDEVLRSVTSWCGRWQAQWGALLRDGLRGLAWVRRLHQQCAELAFKKMQRRQRPDEPGLPEEVRRQRRELRALVEMA